MLDNLREDTRRLKAIKRKGFPWYVLESLLFENGYQAVVLYRIASWFKRHRIPFFGPAFHRLSLFLTGVDIAPGATFGPGLMISHGVGIVVGDRSKIGSGALLLQQVTIGAPSVRRLEQMPVIGDDAFLGAGARIIGGVTLGDRVFVGANAIVTEDVPSDAKVTLDQPLRIEIRETGG